MLNCRRLGSPNFQRYAMKVSPMLICTALLSFALAASPVTVCAQKNKDADKQEEQVTEESMEALQEAMDDLVSALKEKDYEEARAMIDKIAVKYKGGDKAQREAAVKLLQSCLKNKKKVVRNAAITSLGQTGGKAVKILMKGAKASKKDASLQQRYLAAAGKLRDEKIIPDLIKYMNNKDNNTIKTAIYALGRYNESSTKVRKMIVKALLKQYSSVASAYTKPNPSTSDRQKYDALFAPFESTLKKLTKQEMEGFNLWDRWYRKVGKKRKEW